MAFRSLNDRVSSFVTGNIQKALNPDELTQGLEKTITGGSIEKSSKAVISGFREYDRYGQKKEDEAYRVSPRVMRLMYRNNPIVRAAVDTITNEIISAKWDIVPVEKDGKMTPEAKRNQQERIDRVRAFFRHPNDRGENFQTVLKKMMKDLLLLDSGTLEKVSYEDGKGIAELYAIDGGTIRCDADEHGDVRGYWQVIEEEGVDPRYFDKNDIIYLMTNPRTDSVYGLSPLETLHNSVTAFLYGESYNIKYFENDARPSGIIDLGMSVAERELDRFREYWRAEHQQKPHRVMVVGGGGSGVKWIPISTSPKDMEMMNYLNWLMKIILMVFGVTPAEVGWTDDVSRAPATGQMLQSLAFKNRAIYPMMTTVSHYLTECIINQEFGYEDLQFDFIEERSLPDKIQKAQYYQYAIMGKWMTVNEIRKEEGMEPFKLNEAGEPILGKEHGVVSEQEPEDEVEGGESPEGEQKAPSKKKKIDWDKILGGLNPDYNKDENADLNVGKKKKIKENPKDEKKNILVNAYKKLRDDVLTYVEHRANKTDQKISKSIDELKNITLLNSMGNGLVNKYEEEK